MEGLVWTQSGDVTICQVLQSLPHSTVKGSSVRRTQEGQTILPVVHLPVVERGRRLCVDQVLFQDALQDHLKIQPNHMLDRRCNQSLQVSPVNLTCLSHWFESPVCIMPHL